MPSAEHEPVTEPEPESAAVPCGCAAELAALRRELAGLRRSQESRAQIEQAKGMLMWRYGMSADRAFEVLRRWSSLYNVKLRVAAEALVDMCMSNPDELVPGVDPERLLRAVLAGVWSVDGTTDGLTGTGDGESKVEKSEGSARR